MDRLIAEAETEKKQVEIEEKTSPKISVKVKPKSRDEEKQINQPEQQTTSSEYVNSFQNITVADIKREEEKRKQEEFKAEKEVLIQQQFESKPEEKEQEVSQKIIEKPNYDFIEENKKVVKLRKKEKKKKSSSKKIAGIALACTLGASAIVCVSNAVIIDNLNSNFVQIDETYNLNLLQYLKNLYNLDTAQNGMEIIETYPDEMQKAGDLGSFSNWFDIFCSFMGGLFGG